MTNAMRWVFALGATLGAAVALGGCTEGTQPLGFLKSAPQGAAEGPTTQAGAAPARTSTRIVERDVEAPEVFSSNDEGLWDGRPSLGGVWVAHPSVKDPERVIIRNPANGKFVIGALFRRERDNPGPRLQVSSDAAAALDVLAGAPTKLSVVALRREEAPETGAETAPDQAALTQTAPETIVAAPLSSPPGTTEKPVAKPQTRPGSDIAAATGAALAAKPAPAAAPAPPAPTPTAAQTPAKPAATGKMFVQLGIFSVEANAERAAAQMKKAGIAATVRAEQSQGKAFWRVVAGPATSASARDALLSKIKGLGYADAYAVSK